MMKVSLPEEVNESPVGPDEFLSADSGAMWSF